ncbi:GDSL esterase/lipase EXL3 [Eucalyptus grandis]|uniref:GDSL esterase/lipase EXL3 n=1 Tax=Eucalyptus grandis TaxID=71139 RepID=UPI00192EE587|nr:GDSL esterase/lipase EXL3 [Eucalyptus grandis]
MSRQLQLFDEYKMKLKSFIGEKRADSVVANGLYVVSAGSNDIANTYFHTLTRLFDYSVSSYTELLARSASSFLQSFPTRTLAGGIERRCTEDYNQMAQLLNSKLTSELHRLNGAFPRARMALIDIYGPLLDIMKNPRKYGYVFWDSFHPTENVYNILVHGLLGKVLVDLYS